MTVYVVQIEYLYDSTDILGIYKDRAKAEERVAAETEDNQRQDISIFVARYEVIE